MSVTAESLVTPSSSLAGNMFSKEKMTEIIIAAKLDKGLSWQEIADEVGVGVLWLTSVCFGKNSAKKTLPTSCAVCLTWGRM